MSRKTEASLVFPARNRSPTNNCSLLPCDILVPAALERQITAANAGKIQCRILAEAANGPTTPDADEILSQRPEIFIIPDVLCNAGGVIVSYFEWVQDLQSFFWGETEITDKLFRILETSWTQILNRSRKQKISMRMAALSGASAACLKPRNSADYFREPAEKLPSTKCPPARQLPAIAAVTKFFPISTARGSPWPSANAAQIAAE